MNSDTPNDESETGKELTDVDVDGKLADIDLTPHGSTTYKVLGQKDANDGAGVLGHNTATGGDSTGVLGVTDSSGTGSAGLEGRATQGSGTTYGVYGTTDSMDRVAAAVRADAAEARGVYSTTRSGDAFYGLTRSGRGIFAQSRENDAGVFTTFDGRRTGVRGSSSDINNPGGSGYGVEGRTEAVGTGSSGVYGEAEKASGQTYGVNGITRSENFDAAGVRGEATTTSGNARGVIGVANGPIGVGVEATAPNGGVGVFADAGSGGNAITANNSVIVNDRMDVSTTISDSLADEPSNYPLFVENSDDSGNLVLGLKTGVTGDPGTLNNFVQFLSPDGSGGTDFNGTIQGDGSGGVTYETSGADYAEYLPRLDPEETVEAGDVVGVFGDAISRRTEGASRALVVSDAPNVAGNTPQDGETDDHETVAFTGQVPVKVRGPVDDGDLVVPSGAADGTGVAISPAEWRPGTAIVGQAWESDDDEGVSEVTVAVGVDDPAVVGGAMRAQRDRIEDLADENAALRERVDELADRLADLETRMEPTSAPEPTRPSNG